MESVAEVLEEAGGLRQPRFWIRIFLLLNRLFAKDNEPCVSTHTHTHTRKTFEPRVRVCKFKEEKRVKNTEAWSRIRQMSTAWLLFAISMKTYS